MNRTEKTDSELVLISDSDLYGKESFNNINFWYLQNKNWENKSILINKNSKISEMKHRWRRELGNPLMFSWVFDGIILEDNAILAGKGNNNKCKPPGRTEKFSAQKNVRRRKSVVKSFSILPSAYNSLLTFIG